MTSLVHLLLEVTTQSVKLVGNDWDDEIKSYDLNIEDKSYNKKLNQTIYTLSGDQKNLDVFVMHSIGPKGVRVGTPRTMLPWGTELGGCGESCAVY